jgi:hypothetical protein
MPCPSPPERRDGWTALLVWWGGFATRTVANLAVCYGGSGGGGGGQFTYRDGKEISHQPLQSIFPLSLGLYLYRYLSPCPSNPPNCASPSIYHLPPPKPPSLFCSLYQAVYSVLPFIPFPPSLFLTIPPLKPCHAGMTANQPCVLSQYSPLTTIVLPSPQIPPPPPSLFLCPSLLYFKLSLKGK